MKRFVHTWYGAWIIQALECALLSVVAVFLAIFAPEGGSLILLRIMQWGALPAFAGYSAYRAVRRGLNPYLAFLLPAPIMVAAYWGITGMPPQYTMAVFLCALISLLGAATGYEVNRRGPEDGGR